MPESPRHCRDSLAPLNALKVRWLLPVVLAIGCAAPQRTPAVTVATVAMTPDEQLGVDDVFEVRVYDEPELTGPFRVAGDGSINYPFVGRMIIAGLRSGDLEQQIATKLKEGQFLKNPQVTVMVKEWNSRKISVLGQVQKPGSVSYFPRMTIVDAIAAAGGFTGIAAKNNVTLTRQLPGKVESRMYPVADISQGRQENVVLLPGDMLVVDERLF
jgi:protein involved in polysaccharide export with SLBB domain